MSIDREQQKREAAMFHVELFSSVPRGTLSFLDSADCCREPSLGCSASNALKSRSSKCSTWNTSDSGKGRGLFHVEHFLLLRPSAAKNLCKALNETLDLLRSVRHRDKHPQNSAVLPEAPRRERVHEHAAL